MRISTITNWAYGATVVLTLTSGTAFILSGSAATAERNAIEARSAHDSIVDDLELSTALLSAAAQHFVMRGDPRHAAAFRREIAEVRTRERAIERFNTLGAPASERAALAEADEDARALAAQEARAIAMAEQGDREAARALIFGAEYEATQADLDTSSGRFEQQLGERTHAAVVRAQQVSDRFALLARIMLGATAALFLGVLYFVLSRRIARPLMRMSGVVSRLAEQDYAVEMPEDERRDEIGDMAHAIRIFRQNGLDRDRLEADRARDQLVRDRLARMLHRMQGCETQEELAEVVACFAPQVFPELAGKLFAFDAARNLLVEIGGWLGAAHSAAAFVPNECWGLRRGHAHVSNGHGRDIGCPHLSDLGAADSLCVPLVAQGDTVGLLYFEELSADPDRDRSAPRVYLEIMAENVGLALANIRLRQTLRSLAVRDPLTGLYNRRYLDEALNREVDRAHVAGRPLACVMIDIDHFKRFNDSFGHDAGDSVMQHVAQIIARHCGPADHACRYGGEEFALVLEDCDIDCAVARAEAIRVATRDIAIAHHGRALGSITASFGVASLAPEENATTLLQRADAALLEAKRGGRDRVVAGGNGNAGAALAAG